MKRYLLATIAALFMTTAMAQAADVKIGFVNIAKVMDQSPQADSAKKALEKEFSARDAKLASERDAIIEMERKLETDGDVMSAGKRDETERELTRRKREFNRASSELKDDFNQRRNEELGKLQHSVYDVIVDIAKTRGYDLVVTERVLYASDRIDFTDEVITRLKSGGGGASSSGSAPRPASSSHK